ncbi:hypothetical protein EYF80_028442 [Liparis tanakae]|uniref:Uncharacterized protein n=1 Tax=Liparis tanakae TaxID=230148 RepID=A0A4Z2H7V8_9TELE|nr:hypothetical protein EYF80_028442 [Liparis tanakae]
MNEENSDVLNTTREGKKVEDLLAGAKEGRKESGETEGKKVELLLTRTEEGKKERGPAKGTNDGADEAGRVVGLAQCGDHFPLHKVPTAIAAGAVHALVVQRAQILSILHKEATLGEGLRRGRFSLQEWDVGCYIVIMPECQKSISNKDKCRRIYTITCQRSLKGQLEVIQLWGYDEQKLLLRKEGNGAEVGDAYRQNDMQRLNEARCGCQARCWQLASISWMRYKTSATCPSSMMDMRLTELFRFTRMWSTPRLRLELHSLPRPLRLGRVGMAP